MVPDCQLPARASLEERSLCLAHFISTCYTEIDDYSRSLKEQGLRELFAERVRRFVVQCTRQATDLAYSAENLENIERARLLDIILYASEILRHLRRSPRKVESVRIKLVREDPLSFEETTETKVLSRYGALLECQQSLEMGQKVIVVRLDNEQKVRGRVIWVRATGSGSNELGIEFLGSENFWGLNWDEP